MTCFRRKTKEKTNKKAPKGSWIDENGKRWTKVLFDVMSCNGTHFERQVQVILGMHFDFNFGEYVFDLDLGEPMAAEVRRQYPSLGGVGNLLFRPTVARVM